MAVRFKDDTERLLFERAKLGEDVRSFLASPVGILMHTRAKQLIEDARKEALEVDPDGWRGWLFARPKLRKARQKAELGTAFIDWMADAIIDGNDATRQIEEGESNG